MNDEKIDRLLDEIATAVKRNDRGMLANLRAGLNAGTEERAWPLIAPYCWKFTDEADRRIWLVAAGLSAVLETLDVRSFASVGMVMRNILYADGKPQDSAVKTHDAKFRRVLNSADSLELCDAVVGVVRMAKQKGIAVNCRQLFWDLQGWRNEEKRDSIKLRWARDFYRAGKEEEA